jgi:hypothetical protein
MMMGSIRSGWRIFLVKHERIFFDTERTEKTRSAVLIVERQLSECFSATHSSETLNDDDDALQIH